MRFSRIIVVGITLLVLIAVASTFYRQNQQIQNGQVIVLDQNHVGDPGHMFVIKESRQMVDKTNTFPIILWEGGHDQVFSQHSMVGPNGVYTAPSIPATEKEIAIFRTYFPIRSY